MQIDRRTKDIEVITLRRDDIFIKKITKSDFETPMLGAGLTPKVIENIFMKFKKLLPKWGAFVDQSFINTRMKNEYKELIIIKAKQLELIK